MSEVPLPEWAEWTTEETVRLRKVHNVVYLLNEPPSLKYLKISEHFPNKTPMDVICQIWYLGLERYTCFRCQVHIPKQGEYSDLYMLRCQTFCSTLCRREQREEDEKKAGTSNTVVKGKGIADPKKAGTLL